MCVCNVCLCVCIFRHAHSRTKNRKRKSSAQHLTHHLSQILRLWRSASLCGSCRWLRTTIAHISIKKKKCESTRVYDAQTPQRHVTYKHIYYVHCVCGSDAGLQVSHSQTEEDKQLQTRTIYALLYIRLARDYDCARYATMELCSTTQCFYLCCAMALMRQTQTHMHMHTHTTQTSYIKHVNYYILLMCGTYRSYIIAHKFAESHACCVADATSHRPLMIYDRRTTVRLHPTSQCFAPQCLSVHDCITNWFHSENL